MGKIHVDVQNAPIFLKEIYEWSPDLSHGAGNIFVGYVRDVNLGKQVSGIDYDCFIPMAKKIFKDIAREAQKIWGDDANICIIHRHGHLNIGEISVIVMVSTRHRDESYQASRYIIEEIKTRAPIWKKEFYTDGESEWVRGHALCQHSKGTHHVHVRNHTCGGDVYSHESR